MIDLELELVRESPHYLDVLRAYQAAHQELSQESAVTVEAPTETGRPTDSEAAEAGEPARPAAPQIRKSIWLPRLVRVDGVDSEELSRVHGKLIAYGLLKCDLADRAAGVVYQLTGTGRQVIARMSTELEEPRESAA